jgi:hypothetical protein
MRDSMAKGSKQLLDCIKNDDFPASLERRKIYVALQDGRAEKHGLVRVVDESGDDYHYPKDLFRAISLPQAIKKAIVDAA